MRDIDASARFYRDQLGLDQVAQMGKALFLAGAAERTHHELHLVQAEPDAERGGLGLNHLAFRIGTTDDELRSSLAELESHGVTPIRVVDHGGVTHSAYFLDPDGNRVELYIDVRPTWRPGVVDGSRGLGHDGTPLAL